MSTRKRKAGRKSLYTPELHKAIVDALSTGVSVKDACAYVGIDDKTFYRWQGEKNEFREDTTRARSSGRMGAAAVVRRAALSGDVDAAQWYLERTDPQTWGRTTKVILEVDPTLQKKLQAWAIANRVDLAEVFEAMINESVVNADSEE